MNKKELKIRYWMIWIAIGLSIGIIGSMFESYLSFNKLQILFSAFLFLIGFIIGTFGKYIDKIIIKLIKRTNK